MVEVCFLCCVGVILKFLCGGYVLLCGMCSLVVSLCVLVLSSPKTVCRCVGVV